MIHAIRAAGHELALDWRRLEVPPEAEVLFDNSTARIGLRECRVRSLAAPDRDFLEIAGAGTFALPHGEDRIEIDPEPGACGDDFLEQALLGPVLILALARRGIFVLHASASVMEGGVVGFLGASGAGKSTMARLLAAEGLPRAADDLLALTDDGRLTALPHFPQPKLREAEMADILALEPRYPLLGLYELIRSSEVATSELPMAQSSLMLIQHTVGGKLFDTELMAVHFGFAVQLATRVPVRRLFVPWRMNVGKEVAAELAKKDL